MDAILPYVGLFFVMVFALVALTVGLKTVAVREEQYETEAEQEEKYLLAATAIDAGNAQSIIDYGLETGEEHPLLTARKAQYEDTSAGLSRKTRKITALKKYRKRGE